MGAEIYPNFVVMRITSLTYDWSHSFPVVELTETQNLHRKLSIPLGMGEATALHQAMKRVMRVRPGTHDLFHSVLARTHIDLICCRIVSCKDGIYFAEIDLMTPKGRETIDCRVSDGLILCCLQTVEAPILCDEVLFTQ